MGKFLKKQNKKLLIFLLKKSSEKSLEKRRGKQLFKRGSSCSEGAKVVRKRVKRVVRKTGQQGCSKKEEKGRSKKGQKGCSKKGQKGCSKREKNGLFEKGEKGLFEKEEKRLFEKGEKDTTRQETPTLAVRDAIHHNTPRHNIQYNLSISTRSSCDSSPCLTQLSHKFNPSFITLPTSLRRRPHKAKVAEAVSWKWVADNSQPFVQVFFDACMSFRNPGTAISAVGEQFQGLLEVPVKLVLKSDVPNHY